MLARSTNGNAIEGYTVSGSKSGVFGKNESGTGIGVLGEGGGYGVYSKGHLYVQGNIYATGSKSGYVVDIALNDDNVNLETGDLVIISGVASPIMGEIPIIKVRRASTQAATGVVGVVDQHFSIERFGEDAAQINQVDLNETSIKPGEYLTIVTLGAFKAIKVDASFGPISAGDLLMSSSNPGFAMVAISPPTGAVIGKALQEVLSGMDIIPVLINLQ